MSNPIKNVIAVDRNVSANKARRIFTSIQDDRYGLGSVDFNKLIPIPKSIESDENAWFKWCFHYWGTRHPYDFLKYDHENKSIVFTTSSWPPEPVVKALSKKYADIVFLHK